MDAPRNLQPPDPAVVVLAGPAGCGKSTFARRHFAPGEVLSSDGFHELVTGDPGDQTATAAAFGLMRHALEERMKRRRFTVLDATSVTPRERGRHTEVSRRDDVPCIAVAFDLPLAVCQQRTRQRREHHLTGRHRDWEGFFAGMGRDAPVQPLVDLVTWASTEAAVILLAGRPARPGAAAQRVNPARPGGPR